MVCRNLTCTILFVDLRMPSQTFSGGWRTFLTSRAWLLRNLSKRRKSEVQFIQKIGQKRFGVYAIVGSETSETCVRHADTVTTAKSHDVGESDFFLSSLKLAHTDNFNARLWMVSWQNEKKKKEQEEKDGNSRLSWVLGPCVGLLLSDDPRKKNSDIIWHKARQAESK